MTSPSATPKPAIPLNIPHSSSTVAVRVIDAETTLYLEPGLFWQPPIKGSSCVQAPDYCFLISNGDRHIVFDLGVRRDWENYAAPTVSLIQRTTHVETKWNVSEILDSTAEKSSHWNIRSADIEAVIWSHHHFDHIGDPSTFPPTTDLVVGPGVRDLCWPGYPRNSNALVLDSDIQGRNVREIQFGENQDATDRVRIGRFDAVDFFGDGSFYLLDAPGHSQGHMCGLARVTSEPDSSFVLMGADACHHPGILRPTEYLPLPPFVSAPPMERFAAQQGYCPGDLVQKESEDGPKSGITKPFLTVSPTLFPDHETALETVRKIQELDASESIFVILAHDKTLKGRISFYPETINDWQAKGYRSSTRWLFCDDF